ncbi:MAG: ISL3 family transposase [Acidimicrobiales bacterium]
MRVSSAFNRMLEIPGAWVQSVSFTPDGVVVELAMRARRHRCPCGYVTRTRYDTRCRRWRHLDLGACQTWLEADIARIRCPTCGVRTEQVPWARPRARHTKDFEDVVAWLAQRTDKTSVATLLRCSWEAVDHIVNRVVDEHLDDARLDGLYHLGVDEISYKRGHNYLTIVADHDQGRVVWVEEGKHALALSSFYEALGPERREQVRAVSMDLGSTYRAATERAVPHAAICFDPFHVIQLTNRALDQVYMGSRHGADGSINGKQWRTARYALRAGAERLADDKRELLAEFRRTRYRLWRAWELKERLRDLYRVIDPADARDHLQRWLRSAARSRIKPFVNLARQLRRHFERIVASAEWGLSNSRLEGINGKIRVIQRRGYGHPSPKSLASMTYLCLGGISITLPTQR